MGAAVSALGNLVLKTSVNGRKRELHLKPTQEGIGAEKLVSAVHEAAGMNKSAIDQNQATDKTASAPAHSAPALKPKSAPAPPPPKEAVAKAPKAATSSTPPKSKIAGPFRVRALDLSSSDEEKDSPAPLPKPSSRAMPPSRRRTTTVSPKPIDLPSEYLQKVHLKFSHHHT